MNSRVTIIAIAIFSMIFAAIATPIYKSYLIQARLNEAVNILANYSDQTWPHSNLYTGLTNDIVYNIPYKIHLVWLGGELPNKYLVNLNSLAALCKNMTPSFEVNIWTDQGSRNANQDSFQQIAGLTVLNVENELLSNVLADNSPYSNSEKSSFLNWILFEYLTPTNYAAISDLLRIEILRQYGGLYLDTDVVIKTELEFATNLKALFSKVASNGGFSCRKNGYITNNNIIIAAKDPIVSEKLKALVQYMIISMTDQYLNRISECLKDKENYFIAKKSPVPIQITDFKTITVAQKDFIEKLTVNGMPAIRGLTMAEGPFKLAVLAEQYLTRASYSTKFVSPWYFKRNIISAPGLQEMERLFNCYSNDNTWLDKTTKSISDTKLVLTKVKSQVKFYLEHIHNVELQTVAKHLQVEHTDQFANLDLHAIFKPT